MHPALGGGLTALGWGGADFIARFTGRALGPVTALFGMLVVSAVVLSGVVWWLGEPRALQASGWWLVLVYGVTMMVATVALYRGLARGPVTVVAPIVGSFPAFNVVLALFLGLKPTSWQWLAMAAVMLGVVTVARAARSFEHAGAYSRRELSTTITISLASAFLFSMTVAAGQEAGVRFGELEAVCGARWVSITCCVVLFAWRRQHPRIPLRWWPVLSAQGLLDGGAYLALLAGSEGAGSALTAVVASTFSAVTVVLGRMILREAMTWLQWGGIAMILAGVMVLSAQ